MYDVNFLASAIGKTYEDMLVPFTFFALSSNPHSFVEIIVIDPDQFELTYEKEIKSIREFVGDSFLVRKFQNKKNHHHAGVYRFFEVPEEKGKYTYIVDVDIMLLEYVLPPYLSNWPDTSLPYNNAMRRNSTRRQARRMSGLHFVETERYYTPKLIQFQQELYAGNKYGRSGMEDEMYLYDLCQHAHGLVDESCRWRPIFGIHFSPKRGPGKRMELAASTAYFEKFVSISEEYASLFEYPVFSNLLESLLSQFEVSEEFLERNI